MNKNSYFTNQISSWGKKNIIKYPWRREEEPYKILISEVFLRKTNAEQVEEIYVDFIEKYPSLEKIVNTDLEEIRKDISKLGLSRTRSKQLKQISNSILKEYGGKIPDDGKDLKKLPGIGQYTSNSIQCFAFNKPVPIVDTNVIRILQRFFEINSSKKRPRNDPKIWKKAEKLVPSSEPKRYNYALLDLGKKACTKNKPNCRDCLLNQKCSQIKSK